MSLRLDDRAGSKQVGSAESWRDSRLAPQRLPTERLARCSRDEYGGLVSSVHFPTDQDQHTPWGSFRVLCRAVKDHNCMYKASEKSISPSPRCSRSGKLETEKDPLTEIRNLVRCIRSLSIRSSIVCTQIGISSVMSQLIRRSNSHSYRMRLCWRNALVVVLRFAVIRFSSADHSSLAHFITRRGRPSSDSIFPWREVHLPCQANVPEMLGEAEVLYPPTVLLQRIYSTR